MEPGSTLRSKVDFAYAYHETVLVGVGSGYRKKKENNGFFVALFSVFHGVNNGK